MKRQIVTLLLLASSLTPQAFAANDHELLARNMLRWLQEAKADSLLNSCTEQVKSQLPAASIGMVWKQIEMQAGEWKKQHPWQCRTTEGHEIHQTVLEFTRANLCFNVMINKEGKVEGFTFTPAPSTTLTQPEKSNEETPTSVVWEELPISVTHQKVSLPGTLTLPRERKGSVPVIVMVQGSGPCDRDETIGPNKPFQQLAHKLAEQGIATLRYDKRTYVYRQRTTEVSDGHINYDTEIVDDAVEALHLASTTSGIDTKRIYLLGHSLGGTLAPRIAEKTKTPLAGFIGLAAASRPFWKSTEEQLRYIVSLSGKSEEEVRQAATEMMEKMKASLPQEYRDMQDAYHPLATAQNLPASFRMLFLQGGNDYQVTQADFELWQNALASSHPKAQFRFFETLDHLMRPLPHKATPQDYMEKGSISQEVIKTIADFVHP